MCRLGWIIAFIFFLAFGGMFYKFVFSGDVVPASDGRKALQLSPGERDLVLAEMRQFLAAVQSILRGVNDKDPAAIAQAARAVGQASVKEVPPSLMGKLPLSFKRLGLGTHAAFDRLALDAEQLGDPEQSLGQLAILMENCVGCHAVYRIHVVANP